MYVIYGLEDQRTYEIFYVGQTDDIQGRFLQHLRCDGSNPVKDARIREMRDAGYLPLPRTFQIVIDSEQVKKREAYWIRHYYDMGVELTNQVIPMLQDNIIVVKEMVKPDMQGKRLRARMTLDEQKEYILHLLDQGISRRQILARVDGYVHSDVANAIIDETIIRPESSPNGRGQVLAPDAGTVPDEDDEIKPLGPDDLTLDDRQTELLKFYFEQKGYGINKCLSMIPHATQRGKFLGRRYFRHASNLIKQNGWKRGGK